MRKHGLIAALIAVVAGAWLAVAAGPVWTQGSQTEEQGFVENLIAELLSSQGRTLQVRDVGIGLTGNVTIGHIEVHDRDGAWLVVEKAALDWQPFSLIGTTLVVNELRAERISVLRLPEEVPDGEAPDEAADLGGVVVDRLAIDDLDMNAAVFGQALRLTAQGSMRITQDPRVVSLKLSARHTEGSPGQIDATIAYDQASEKLSVDVTLNEAGGGILTTVLPLSDDVDVAVRIAGTGRIADWAGDLKFSVEDEAIIEGRAQIKGESDGYAVSLDVAGAFDALTPEGLDGLFLGRSELSVLAHYATGTPMLLEHARLGSQTVEISLHGTLDTDGSDTAVTLEARTLGAAPVTIELDALPFSALGLAEAVISGQLQGPLDHPGWFLEVRAAAVSTEQATLGNLRIDGSGVGLVPSDETASEFSIALAGNVVPETAGAIPPLLEGAVSATLKANWTDSEITILEARVDAARYRLTSAGSYSPGDSSFELGVDLSGDTLETGHPTADLLLRGPVRLSGKVAGRSFERLTFEAVSFTSPALQAQIDGEFDDKGSTDLSAAVTIPDLTVLHEAAEGRAVLQARLNGPFDALRVDFIADGENVAVAGRSLDDLKLSVSGIVDDGVPRLDVDLAGSLVDEPIRLTARVVGDQAGTLRIEDISGRAGAAEIGGAITMVDGGAPEGTLTLEVPNLADLSDPALQGLRGSLATEIVLTAENGLSNADVRLEGANLARDDLRVDWLAVRAKISDLLGDAHLSGSGLLQGAALGDTGLGNFAFEMENAAAPQAYRVTLREAGGRWTVRSLLELETEDTVAVVHVKTLRATLPGVDVELARATALRIAADSVSLDRTELVAGSGRLVLEGAISPALTLRADLDRLSLEIVNAVMPDLGLRGSVSGTIAATGALASPLVEIRLDSSGVSSADLREQGLPSVSLQLDGTVKDEVLKISGQIRNSEVALSLTGTVGLAGPGRVDLAVAGELPSEVLAQMGAENDLVVRGGAVVDLRVRGSFDDVSFSGSVAMAGATFGDAGGRFTVRDVNARIVIDGDVARVEHFSGSTAGGDGRVTLSGTVGLSAGSRMNLSINVSRGRYIDGTLLVTLFDAALTVRGPLDGPLTLAGTIDLIQPKVTLSELPPASLTPLGVEHRSAPQRVVEQQQALARNDDAASAAGLFIDAEIRIADRLVDTGRGINAELDGRLRLVGPLDAPGAFGSFSLVRGSVDVLNTKVEFSTGELDFIGNLNPQIRFAGTVRTASAAITLNISGPADAPRISITSVPDLPEEEALALLIFGRPSAELSPLQVAQLAGSVALLSGGSGGGLFDSLQNMLGATTIEVVRTEEGETAVNVGRQLTDQLSVGVQQETGTGVRRVIIDLDVTKNLILRGSVGEDRSTKTGIFFETEY